MGITIAFLVGVDGSELSMPSAIAGYDRVTGPEIDDLVENLKRGGAGTFPNDPVLGVYGSLAEPRFLVIAVAAAPPPGDPLTGLDPDLTGLGTSGSVDLDAATRRTEGDVTYTCVPYTMTTSIGGSVRAEMCIWTATDTYGFVMSFDPSLQGLDLVPQVYEAVVG